MAKKQKKAVQLKSTPESYIKTRARSLEIDRCYVNKDWQDKGMANVIVVRRHPKGTLTVGGYLVDTLCLGVKDCFYCFSIDENELEDSILYPAKMGFGASLQEVDYTTAHNIVYGGLEYAAELGIAPHKNWAIAKYILEEDNDDIPLIEFDFGKDGRPQLCAMTNLEASRYKSILDKSVGRGNYDVCIDSFDDDDEDSDEEYLDNGYETEITGFILDSVQDMSTPQEALYHIVALSYAHRSSDASNKMKQYADLVDKDDVTLEELHNAHVDAVISLENMIKAYDNYEEYDAMKMTLATTFLVFAQITCELINDMSEAQAEKWLSSEESITDFFNKCDEEVARRAETTELV